MVQFALFKTSFPDLCKGGRLRPPSASILITFKLYLYGEKYYSRAKWCTVFK